MDTSQLLNLLEPIAMKIKNWDGIIKIYYTNSVDSIVAASIFGRVFLDLKRPCILSILNSDSIPDEKFENNPVIFLGIKSEKIDNLTEFNESIIILNPHDYEIDNENKWQNYHNLINLFGWKDPENPLTISAIAYFICNPFAITLDYIVRLPLISYTGLFGIKPFLGIHNLICTDAIEGSVAKFEKRFTFLGSDVFSIPEILKYSHYPFLPGLSGNEVNVHSILAKSGVELTRGSKERTLLELSKQEMTDLNSRLVLFMSTQKGHQEDEMTFIRDLLIFSDEKKKGFATNILDFSVSVLDAIHRNQISLVVTVLMGNRSGKLLQLQKLFNEERKALSVSFQILKDHASEIEDLGALRIYSSDRKVSWYNASLTSGLVLANSLVEIDKPFATITPGPSDKVTIGLRASKLHKVGDGLNSLVLTVIKQLGYAVKVSGSKLSAQITIDNESSRELLLNINSKLVELNL